MSSRKGEELPRDRGSGDFFLELPHCWNDEILKMEFQVENEGIWGGEEFLLAMLLKPSSSISQICPSPYGLRIRFYTFRPPLYILEQTRAPCIRATCCSHRSSSDSTPLVIVVFPKACKVHFRLWVPDLVILEPVVAIQNSVRIHPPQTSMLSHLPVLLKKQTIPHSCPAHLLPWTCLQEMMWHLSFFFKGHHYFFQDEDVCR